MITRKKLKSLLAAHSASASQTGQDLWVFGEAFNLMRRGYFVDVGAHDGLSISNTVLLERRFAWTGVCIEANPTTFKELRKNRRCHCVNACLDEAPREVEFEVNDVFGGIVDAQEESGATQARSGRMIKVKTRTLTDVLDECGAPREIDYMSVDVEGAEDRVFRGLDLDKYVVKAMTIERPSDQTEQLLHRYGYQCVKMLPGLDYCYIHADFKDEYVRNTYLYYSKLKITVSLH